MDTDTLIKAYIDGQPATKRADLRALDARMRALFPAARLWFLDGRDGTGKVVTNPNIGYGERGHRYADGETRPFYRVGLSANSAGISVYIMGIEDKTYLASAYGKDLGKANVTGYCIRFKALKDIDMGVLEAAMRYGMEMK